MSLRFGAALVALVTCMEVPELMACGDKFLLLGRSVGYDQVQKASRPGTVLIYSSSSLPKAFSDGQFAALMEIAGHHQRSVADRQALARALSTGKVDLVLADPMVSRDIAETVRSSSSALVVPVLSNAAAAQRAEFGRDFRCVLALPANARRVIDTLDKAMKLKGHAVARPAA